MDARVEKMAVVIVNYSLGVKRGERVLIRGTSPAAALLAEALYMAALRAGGQAFTYLHIADENSLAIEATEDLELLAAVNPMLKLMYETCDCIVRVEASENPRALSDYPVEGQRARAKAGAEILHIQMRREGEG